MNAALQGPAHAAALDQGAAQRLDDTTCALEAALGLANTLHWPGQRDRYRSLLDRAIDQARRALAAAEEEHAAVPGDAPTLEAASVTAALRCTLARAHAARAEDALHGAGQLSRSAQRAPTREACDDGWRRVEAIVAGAEASAGVAADMAAALEADPTALRLVPLVRAAAQRAITAATSARRIVDERNDAYTFHTDNGFSFGEGWYLAAAAVLADAAIQVEPGKPGTPRAETFLRDAGLSEQLRPYRPRPRAMKQVTEIVARVFEADPVSAQRRLRAAFLADSPIPTAVTQWIDDRLSGPASAEPTTAEFSCPDGALRRTVPKQVGGPCGSGRPDVCTRRSLLACATTSATGRRCKRKVLLWIRQGVHDAHRNTRLHELMALTDLVRRAGLTPVWTGDTLPDAEIPPGVVDFVLFWKDPPFQQSDMRRAQLQFFEHLKTAHGLVGQLGVTTAGMDGPALLGLPTIYLTDAPNVRMREWVGAVPGYEELLRQNGYLDRVGLRLSEWARHGAG